jgi:hypothetical protein
VKVLLVSPSPRDIPDVKNALDKIPCDKLFAKYYKQPEAYKLMRNFFLERKEYDYIAIVPDDLIVTPIDYMTLLEDLFRYNYPAIGGICNNHYETTGRRSNEFNVAWTLAGPGWYWWTGEEIADNIKKKGPIHKVEFLGFGFIFIRRDIVEAMEFRGAMDSGNAAFDLGFAFDCKERNIPIHVDLRVNMDHLKWRAGYAVYENWGMDKGNPPYCSFQKYNEPPFLIK